LKNKNNIKIASTTAKEKNNTKVLDIKYYPRWSSKRLHTPLSFSPESNELFEFLVDEINIYSS